MATSAAPGRVRPGGYGHGMSRIPNVPGGVAQAISPGQDTRARIAAAAFELFADRGYDGTTVDAIAEQAGIARRTFFRYFKSKDDVIFPDHDSLLATVQRHLQASGQSAPIEAITGGVRLVFESYVTNAHVSIQRYRLTRSVMALRDRELSSVRRYERAFSKYVRQRLAGLFPEPEAALRGDVMAASIVAAHNAVLREWLRAGGDYDPRSELDAAFAWVASTMDHSAAPTASGLETGDGVVVAVFRADQPLGDVVERISRSL
jgi:AcrR family transcriptional regulator